MSNFMLQFTKSAILADKRTTRHYVTAAEFSAAVPMRKCNVKPAETRRGVGREMTARLFTKVSGPSRRRIMLDVRESNLDAQLFFSRMGFRAVSVLKEFYDDSTEDAYRMLYRYRSAPISNSGELILTHHDETL